MSSHEKTSGNDRGTPLRKGWAFLSFSDGEAREGWGTWCTRVHAALGGGDTADHGDHLREMALWRWEADGGRVLGRNHGVK